MNFVSAVRSRNPHATPGQAEKEAESRSRAASEAIEVQRAVYADKFRARPTPAAPAVRARNR